MRKLAGLALLALPLAGCSIGGLEVSTEDLESEISTRLAQEVGRTPERVDCPDALDAEVGAEVRCTLTDSGETWGITVTATEVVDKTVSFDVEVDMEPQATS